MGSLAHKLFLYAEVYVDLGNVTIPALNGTNLHSTDDARRRETERRTRSTGS